MTTSAINLTTLITDKVKDLPLEKQQEILDFTEFISNKYHQDKETESKPKKKRIAGLHKGKGWISDDFNDPFEKLSTVIDEISEKHQPVCLELPNAIKAIVLSEEDYNSMVETLHLLSNPVNAEKLLNAINRSVKDTISWQQVKDELK